MYLNDNLDQAIKKLISQALEDIPSMDSEAWKPFVQRMLCTDDFDEGNWQIIGEDYYQSLLQLSALSDNGNFTWTHFRDPHSRFSKCELNDYIFG